MTALALLLLLLLPGLPLAVLLDEREEDPLCFLAAVGACGSAVWIVGFWLLRYLPLELLGLIAAVTCLSAACLVLAQRRVVGALRSLSWRGDHRLSLGLMAMVLVLRFLPLALAPVAPGADMSMHSYMAQLILDAGGVPSSYQPLLPIEEFGAYPAGLQTLGALVATIADARATDGVFVIACFSHLLVSLAVYAFVRRRVSVLAALGATVLVTLGSRDPQFHFVWGGNPTVLSLALVTFGLAQLERLEGDTWPRALLPGALVLAAAPMTHSVLPFALVYALPSVLAFRLVHLQTPGFRLRLVGRGTLLAALIGLLMIPYLLHLGLVVSPQEKQWILDWQRLPAHVPGGPWWAFPALVPWHLVKRLGAFFVTWLLAALAARRWLKGSCAPIGEELVFAAAVLLLVLNAKIWVLPGSFALYPDRVTLLLVPIFARVVGSSLDGALIRWGKRRLARLVGVGALLATLAAGYGIWYIRGIGEVSVTDDDLQAIRWIERNTPADAVIANNYGDAGIWIPALAMRSVHHPHANVVYLDEVNAWKPTVRPSHLFIGAKRVYEDDSPWSLKKVRGEPERFKELFTAGEAAVFRIGGGQ